MTTNLSRSQLRARYYITGRIVLDTALHIGGRGPVTITDSPIVRDGAGRPYIPGSSLKGAFRAAVERIVPNIPGMRTCVLSDEESACAERLRVRTKDHQFTETEMLALLDEILCDTCRAFGTTHLASVALFHDAPISGIWQDLPEVPTQIRDGVGIDRDSERAREGVKFDYEVVPPQAEFAFTLILENPSERDLGLVALGLQEFINGMIPLGGIRSRGLGRCRLEDVTVEYVNLRDVDALKAYLIENQLAEISTDKFVKTYLGGLLAEEA